MSDFDLGQLKERMSKTVESLKKEFGGLRTGRASTAMLEPIKANVYGSLTPLNQLGNINVPEPQLLSVTVWDANAVDAVEKAIRDSDLGLNPAREGNVIRIPVPSLSEERRTEIVKVAKKYAEDARISIRNIRRDGMDALKKQEKDGDISEDQQHALSDDVQKLTDKHVDQVDEMLESKEKDIMKV